MTSTDPAEKWWERVPRIVGGWGFAVLIFFKFPFPDEPGLLAWGVYVVLIIFFVGIAHSTVTGIVLGNVTKAIAAVRRAWKGKRASSAQALVQGPDDLESTRKRDAIDPHKPPDGKRGR